LTHPFQVAKRQSVLTAADAERCERIEEARPFLIKLTAALEEDEFLVAATEGAVAKLGSIKDFQGVLELLKVPAALFMNGPRTAVKLAKPLVVKLIMVWVKKFMVEEQMEAANNLDAAAEAAYMEDGFEEEDEDL